MRTADRYKAWFRQAALATVSAALFTLAFAQADWPATQTGTVDFELAGEGKQFYTFAVEIPENVADGHPEGPVRDRLAAAAGTTEHSATWNVNDPVMLGAVVLSTPTEMGVNLGTRPTQDFNAGLGLLLIDFSLSLEALALNAAETVLWSVTYYLETYEFNDFYELTEGSFEVTSVEIVDDTTLRVAGDFEGTLSHQSSLVSVAHNPSDTLPLSGTFDVVQVVGVKSLAEVLGRE